MTWWISSEASEARLDRLRDLLDRRRVTYRAAARILAILGVPCYGKPPDETMTDDQHIAICNALTGATDGIAGEVERLILDEPQPESMTQTDTANMIRRWVSE
jgi:hypothetical protein